MFNPNEIKYLATNYPKEYEEWTKLKAANDKRKTKDPGVFTTPMPVKDDPAYYTMHKVYSCSDFHTISLAELMKSIQEQLQYLPSSLLASTDLDPAKIFVDLEKDRYDDDMQFIAYVQLPEQEYQYQYRLTYWDKARKQHEVALKKYKETEKSFKGKQARFKELDTFLKSIIEKLYATKV